MKSDWAGSGAQPFRDALLRIERRLKGQAVGRILAVDPGVITGVSALYFSLKPGEKYKALAWAETLITHDEIQQVHDLLSFVVVMHNGPIDVVIENFRVGRIAMEESFLSPVRIGRRFEWGLLIGEWFYRVRIYWHFNTDMSQWDDDRLKNVGFYTPGPDHRRDATRHILQHHRQIRTGKVTSWSTIALAERWEPVVKKTWSGVNLSSAAERSAPQKKRPRRRKLRIPRS